MKLVPVVATLGLLLQVGCTSDSAKEPVQEQANVEAPAPEPAEPPKVFEYPEVMPVMTEPPKVLSGKVGPGKSAGVEVYFEVPPTSIKVWMRGSRLSNLPNTVVAEGTWNREPSFEGNSAQVPVAVPADATPGKYLYEVEMRSGPFVARYTLPEGQHIGYQLTTCKTATPGADCGDDAKTEASTVRVPYNVVLADAQ